MTASCYLVKHSIAATLADCLEEGARQLARGGDRAVFGNDEIWTRLQGSHVFVIRSSERHVRRMATRTSSAVW